MKLFLWSDFDHDGWEVLIAKDIHINSSGTFGMGVGIVEYGDSSAVKLNTWCLGEVAGVRER